MLFEKFDLSAQILSGLKDVNYVEPTELQMNVIPAILDGNNVVAKARPGMGKDGSYIIPIIEKLNSRNTETKIRALVLTPEIEHAKKVDEFVWVVGYHAGTQCVSLDMAGDRSTQQEAIDKGVDIVVANPGRLEEFLQSSSISFENLKFIVIDEAYTMAKMGLLKKIEPVLQKYGRNTQKLLYSDRLDDSIKKLIETYIPDPKIIGFENEFGGDNESANKTPDKSEQQATSKEDPIEKRRDIPPPKLDDDLKQGYIFVPPRMKITTLMAHLDESPDDNVLIFTASKRGTDRLFRVLRKRNAGVRSIHERLPQKERERRYKAFKTGEYQFLLITDISAKDIDFDHVKQVINYDVPNDVDEYRYRAGLVGSGKANRIVSLVSKQDRSDIDAISKEVGNEPAKLPLPQKVQEKLKERKKAGNGRSKSSKQSHSRRKDRSDSRKSSKKSRSYKKDGKPELPKPSYEKLRGGRSGSKKEKNKNGGIIGFFKKLFS